VTASFTHPGFVPGCLCGDEHRSRLSHNESDQSYHDTSDSEERLSVAAHCRHEDTACSGHHEEVGQNVLYVLMNDRGGFYSDNSGELTIKVWRASLTIVGPSFELVAIHGPHPAQEGGALIELKLGCIGTGTTRRARLSENRRDDLAPLDRPYQDRAVEYDVFGKQLAHLGRCSVTRCGPPCHGVTSAGGSGYNAVEQRRTNWPIANTRR